MRSAARSLPDEPYDELDRDCDLEECRRLLRCQEVALSTWLKRWKKERAQRLSDPDSIWRAWNQTERLLKSATNEVNWANGLECDPEWTMTLCDYIHALHSLRRDVLRPALRLLSDS